jgi:hypothetical protein
MLIEFLREQVLEELIKLRKIPTESNVADVLTKLIISKAFTIKAMHLLGEMGITIDMNGSSQELYYEQE